jgi:uncharacterized protein YlzI (FlbEa/FlbD family)
LPISSVFDSYAEIATFWQKSRQFGRESGEEAMFFVSGLSSNGKEVLINPDQVLYVSAAGLRRNKTALTMAHRKRLVVDQDTETVRQRFEDYLQGVIERDSGEVAAAGN